MSSKSNSSSSAEDSPLAIKWKNRVKDEVQKIKKDDRLKTRNEISAAWKTNRKTIKENRQNASKEVKFIFKLNHIQTFHHD